jgi:hypothetical protein
MKILYVGVLLNPKIVSKYYGVSNATNNWQYEFIKSINDINNSISVVSYISEKTWPFGKLFPKIELKDLEGLNIINTFTYLNIYYLREFFIYFKIKKIILKYLKTNSFDFMITFNSLIRNKLITNFVKSKLGKATISITGDGQICDLSDISIIQNYNSFLNCRKKYKFFYQGGIPKYKSNNITLSPLNLIFTGTITKLTGIEEFAEQFGDLKIPGIELHIYGKGDFNKLYSLEKKYNNIFIHGYVSILELENAMLNAFAFVNPRNDKEESNQNTFPSKLLEYISYGKPILSSFSNSLDEEFNKLLLLYDSNNIMSLNEQLMVIKNMNNDELTAHKNKLRLYTINNSWEKSTDSLLKYLQSFLISK